MLAGSLRANVPETSGGLSKWSMHINAIVTRKNGLIYASKILRRQGISYFWGAMWTFVVVFLIGCAHFFSAASDSIAVSFTASSSNGLDFSVTKKYESAGAPMPMINFTSLAGQVNDLRMEVDLAPGFGPRESQTKAYKLTDCWAPSSWIDNCTSTERPLCRHNFPNGSSPVSYSELFRLNSRIKNCRRGSLEIHVNFVDSGRERILGRATHKGVIPPQGAIVSADLANKLDLHLGSSFVLEMAQSSKRPDVLPMNRGTIFPFTKYNYGNRKKRLSVMYIPLYVHDISETREASFKGAESPFHILVEFGSSLQGIAPFLHHDVNDDIFRQHLMSVDIYEHSSYVFGRVKDSVRNSVYFKSGLANARYKLNSMAADLSFLVDFTLARVSLPVYSALSITRFVSMLTRSIFSFLAVMIALLGSISLYSMLAIQIDKRVYEFAVARIVGLERRTIPALVIIQTLAFSIPATLIALPVIYYVVREVIIPFLGSSVQDLSYSTLAVAGLIGPVLPTFASIMPIRAALQKTMVGALNSKVRQVPVRPIEFVLSTMRQTTNHVRAMMPVTVPGVALVVAGGGVFFLLPRAVIFGDLFLLSFILMVLLSFGLTGMTLLFTNVIIFVQKSVLRAIYRALKVVRPAMAPLASIASKFIAVHQDKHKRATAVLVLFLATTVVIHTASNSLFSSYVMEWERQAGADISFAMTWKMYHMGHLSSFLANHTDVVSYGFDRENFIYETYASELSLTFKSKQTMYQANSAAFFRACDEKLLKVQSMYDPADRRIIENPSWAGSYFGLSLIDSTKAAAHLDETLFSRYGALGLILSTHVGEELALEYERRFTMIGVPPERETEWYESQIPYVGMFADFGDDFRAMSSEGNTLGETLGLEEGGEQMGSSVVSPRATTSASVPYSKIKSGEEQARSWYHIALLNRSPRADVRRKENSLLPTTFIGSFVNLMSLTSSGGMDVEWVDRCFIKLRPEIAKNRMEVHAVAAELDSYLQELVEAKKIPKYDRDFLYIRDVKEDNARIGSQVDLLFLGVEAVACVMTFMALVSSMTSAVRDSERDIYINRSIGISAKHTFVYLFLEAFAVVFSAGLAGMFNGVLAGNLVLVQFSAFISLPMIPSFPLVTFLVVLVFSIGFAFFATYMASRRILKGPIVLR